MIRYEHISPSLGALVTDWDGNVEHLREAIIERKVVIFRPHRSSYWSNYKVDAKEVINKLGDPFLHPFMPWQKDDGTYIARYNKDFPANENVWHADFTWWKEPPHFEVIHFEYGPPVGGDILFACREKAFELLDTDTQEMLKNTDFHHGHPWDNKLLTRWMLLKGEDRKTIREKLKLYWGVDNDVEELMVFHKGAVKNKFNGKWVLNVMNSFHCRPSDINNNVDIDQIGRVYYTPEINFRWTYQPGDLVFWHNHLCAHYAVQDYYPQERGFKRWQAANDKLAR